MATTFKYPIPFLTEKEPTRKVACEKYNIKYGAPYLDTYRYSLWGLDGRRYNDHFIELLYKRVYEIAAENIKQGNTDTYVVAQSVIADLLELSITDDRWMIVYALIDHAWDVYEYLYSSESFKTVSNTAIFKTNTVDVARLISTGSTDPRRFGRLLYIMLDPWLMKGKAPPSDRYDGLDTSVGAESWEETEAKRREQASTTASGLSDLLSLLDELAVIPRE